MDCRDYDGQVVRLEKIADEASKFVLVRLTRVDNLDLNLFDFDLDLTMMVFFLDAEENVYARYGSRDAKDAESRQSLEGLRHTMESVLKMHERAAKEFAPKAQAASKYLRDLPRGGGSGRGDFGRGDLGRGPFGTGCLHCHQVKEALSSDLRRTGKWQREMVYRYPLPENIGCTLEVDRGNVIQEVADESPAAVAGMKAGDVVQRLHGVPVHSSADVQFALDLAPKSGSIEIAWQRGDEHCQSTLQLRDGWRKTDITWRPSMANYLASARLTGIDLKPDEKASLGLPANQLAFRQLNIISAQARTTGVQGGDVILGIEGQPMEMEFRGFLKYVRTNYLIGDQVTINILRDGERKSLPMKFIR